MNITIVCDVLGSETNGTTIAAMNLIRALQNSNHNVKILCADASKEGIDGYYIVPTLNLGPLNKFVAMNNVSLAKPVESIVRHSLEGADHVHIMLPFGLGQKALKIAKEMGISTTAGFHAQAENLSSHVRMQNVKWVNKGIYSYFWHNFYKYIDGIHYPTKFMRDTFEHSIKKTTNGYVISNGVNNHICRKPVDKPAELKDKIVILSTGRYSVEKNQETLIRAIKYSRHKDNIQLILAGQGPLTNKFKKMCKKLPIPAIMKCFDRNEMGDVLNYCDLYAHPAIVELEGIACLEAICAGKCVIVSDSKKSATKNFAVDDRCIFHAKHPKSLAETLDYWIEHPEERKKIEEKYFESSSAYDQQKCMDEMLDMIEEVHSQVVLEKTADI